MFPENHFPRLFPLFGDLPDDLRDLLVPERLPDFLAAMKHMGFAMQM